MSRGDGARGGNANGAGQRSPVIVLGYAHGGAGYLQRLLDGYGSLACTTGTGLLPLCDLAASTWREVEDRTGPLSPLATASIRAMTSSLIITALAGTGKARWCEIAFAHPRCAEVLIQVYPAAKFICVHRSCPEVILAGIQANPWGLAESAFQPFALRYPGNTVAAIAAYWAANTEPLLDLERAYPDSCHRVRHEDLVASPDQLSAEITAFLSLDHVRAADRHLIDGDLLTVPEGPLFPEPQVPVGWIPPPLMTAVNQLMTRLGYAPVQPAQVQPAQSQPPTLAPHG